jgi:hypothetical protein
MDLQLCRRGACLAREGITLQGQQPLLLPVWTTIVCLSPAPVRIVRPSHMARQALPEILAIAATKVPGGYLARGLRHRGSTQRTGKNNRRLILRMGFPAWPVIQQPMLQTGVITKRMRQLFTPGRIAKYFLTTPGTRLRNAGATGTPTASNRTKALRRMFRGRFKEFFTTSTRFHT